MEMVEFWDRTSLTIKRPRTPSERSDEDGHLQHPPSGKKGKGKGKSYIVTYNTLPLVKNGKAKVRLTNYAGF